MSETRCRWCHITHIAFVAMLLAVGCALVFASRWHEAGGIVIFLAIFTIIFGGCEDQCADPDPCDCDCDRGDGCDCADEESRP